MVMHRDGTVYHAEELSQGTCEQLYTAIRFALAVTRQGGSKLPFQLDDSFVHFDQERLKRVLHVLYDLTHRQVKSRSNGCYTEKMDRRVQNKLCRSSQHLSYIC